MAADLSYSDYAKRMGGDKMRRAYDHYRTTMDDHFSQLDQVLKPPPTPVDPNNPYSRGAVSPLDGRAMPAAMQPVRLAHGGRVEALNRDVRKLAKKYGGRP
jgi:hypothetical protein